MNSAQATPKPESKPAAGKVRNLTEEGVAAHILRLKQAAMDAVPPYEVVKISLPKKNAKGEVIRDADGFVELVEKVVLKRDLVEAEWDKKISG